MTEVDQELAYIERLEQEVEAELSAERAKWFDFSERKGENEIQD